MKFRSIYIWYSVPLVLSVVWLAAFYFPVSGAIKARERELKSLRQESEKIDKETINVLQLKRRAEEARIKLEDFERELPVIDQLPDFIRAMTITARKGGVVVEGFNNIFASLDTGGKLPLVSSVFDLNVKGRFADMGRFVEELGSRKAFKQMLIARITYDEKEYPVLTGRFVVELRAWKRKISSEGK
jgi:Tfp pilus assembly protein PilO